MSFVNYIESKFSNRYIRLLIWLFPIVIGVFLWLNPVTPMEKNITAAILVNEEIVNLSDVQEKGFGKLQVTLDGIPIQKLFYTKLRFKNTGNSGIIKSDIIRDIQITFPESIELVDFRVSSNRATINTRKEENSVVLNFDLLNPSDVFDIEFLSNPSNSSIDLFLADDIKFDFAINGITQIDLTKERLLPIEEQRDEARRFVKDTVAKGFKILILSVMVFGGFILFLLSLGFLIEKHLINKKIVDQGFIPLVIVFFAIFLILFFVQYISPLIEAFYLGFFA